MALDLQEIFFVAACFLGFVSLSKHFLYFLRWVWVMFLRPPKNLKHYGSWGVITGSTEGIGKALAFELASKGLHLVLVGRNPAKLEATKYEIQERFDGQVEIRTVVIDFARSSGDEICKVMEEGIRGVDVGILINNAGLAYPYPRYFHEVDLEMLESVLKVNLEGATWVTKSVLPGMLKKKKGAIVDIGSASSVAVPSYPLFTVYAATKAYAAMFSRCISLEYKQQGIDIQCQIPFFVATKMTKMRKSSMMVASPEMYSKASLRWIGNYEHLCTPYWSHSLQWGVFSALPDALLNWYVFRYFLGKCKMGMLKELGKTVEKYPSLL